MPEAPEGLGFRVWGLGFKVAGVRSRVYGLGFKALRGLGFSPFSVWPHYLEVQGKYNPSMKFLNTSNQQRCQNLANEANSREVIPPDVKAVPTSDARKHPCLVQLNQVICTFCIGMKFVGHK